MEKSAESPLLAELSSLLTKPTDHAKDKAILMQDWCSTSIAVEREVRRIHGDQYADALQDHYQIVLGIATYWSWAVAVEYNIEQHELVYINKSHDYSSLDHTCVTAIVECQALQAAKGLQTLSSPLKHCLGDELVSLSPKCPRGINCFYCGAPGHLPSSCSAPMMIAGKLAAPLMPNVRSPQALQAPDGSQYCFSFAS